MRTDYHYYLAELANEYMAQKRRKKNTKRITSDAMWRNNDYGSREVSSSSISYEGIVEYAKYTTAYDNCWN